MLKLTIVLPFCLPVFTFAGNCVIDNLNNGNQ